MKNKKSADCSSGLNALGPSRKVKAAIRKAVKHVDEPIDAFRARFLGLLSSKFSIPERQVVLANSFRELLYLVPSVLKSRRVRVIGPALKIYEYAATHSGCEVSYLIPDEKEEFLPDTAAAQQMPDGTDLLFLANPNRVTGKAVPQEVMKDIITAVTVKKGAVVVDETLAGFAGEDGQLRDFLNRDNVIVLRTTSHFYGLSGLELAYAVSSPRVAEALNREHHGQVNLLALEAARAAFRDTAYRKATLRHIAHERKLIQRAWRNAKRLKCYPTDSNAMLVKLPDDGEKVVPTLRKGGLEIRDCSDIEGLDKTFLRMSVASHEHNVKLMRLMAGFI